jgi:Lrp/AsnC family transcriptional regulator, leucine-responsive regulatory protein
MKQFDMDEADLRLLDLLQTDAARSNQTLAELAHLSPPTSLRRIKRLRASGLIEREVAILQPDQLAAHLGYGLTALVEITLERQGAEQMAAFEERVVTDPSVQQCYRVSPGPDFMLVVFCQDMPAYLALAQRLFTSDANVRNIKSFFSVKRSKFDPRLPLQRRPAP